MKNNRRGFSLIEVLIAVAILCLIVAAIYTVLASSQTAF
ncbi:MAG: PulJ/GspJ family protein, partial [Planctomycetota bacterium]